MKYKYKVNGLDCANCTQKLEDALNKKRTVQLPVFPGHNTPGMYPERPPYSGKPWPHPAQTGGFPAKNAEGKN